MKFSIRDLLLVTVIVAMGLAWWVDHGRLATDRDRRAKSEASLKRLSDDLREALDALTERNEKEPQAMQVKSAPAPKSPKD